MATFPLHRGPREVVYQNRYHQVYQVAIDFGAFTKQYFVTDYGERAGVVITRDETVLLVRQYRQLIDRLSFEIPGGRVEAGEAPMVAARRECREETGIDCLSLEPLLTFQPGLDTLRNPSYLFVSTDFTEGSRSKDEREVQEIVWLPLQRCIQMIFAGEIVDSLSVIALLAFQVNSNGRTRSDQR